MSILNANETEPQETTALFFYRHFIIAIIEQ